METKLLTFQKAMDTLTKRLIGFVQPSKTGPRIPMKFSSAHITREEFEVIQRELDELITFREQRLNQDELLLRISQIEGKDYHD